MASTLGEKLTIGIFSAALLATGYYARGCPKSPPNEKQDARPLEDAEDERPPVVVSNGSVKIEAVEKHTADGSAEETDPRGKFEAGVGVNVYKHTRKDKKPTKSLGVIILGSGVGNAPGDCGDIWEAVKVWKNAAGKIEIFYSTETDPVTFKIDGDDLTFLTKVIPAFNADYSLAELKKGDPNAWISKVRVQTKQNGSIECNFTQAAKPKIVILQHIK